MTFWSASTWMNGPAGTIAVLNRLVAKSPRLDPRTSRQSYGAACGLPAGGAKYNPGHWHGGYPQLRSASSWLSGNSAFPSDVVPTGMPKRSTNA